MRTGEACALTWDNIDFKKRIISIEHDVYSKVKDEKGRWYISTPKTKKGIRTVYIFDTLLIALKNYKNKQEEFKKSMSDIYSTSVVKETIDEAPFAYKPMQEIIDNIQDTVEIEKVIKPVYNFKAKN